MRNNNGHFKKGHREGFVTKRPKALTAQVALRLTPEDKEALISVPNWQERLRDCIKTLIEDEGE